MAREIEAIETFNAVRAIQELREEKYKAREKAIIEARNSFLNNYYNTIESGERARREYGKVLREAKDEILGKALKAIYITALEAGRLTENNIALAENMVDNYIKERGGADCIMREDSGKSYLLDMIFEKVETEATLVTDYIKEGLEEGTFDEFRRKKGFYSESVSKALHEDSDDDNDSTDDTDDSTDDSVKNNKENDTSDNNDKEDSKESDDTTIEDDQGDPTDDIEDGIDSDNDESPDESEGGESDGESTGTDEGDPSADIEDGIDDNGGENTTSEEDKSSQGNSEDDTKGNSEESPSEEDGDESASDEENDSENGKETEEVSDNGDDDDEESSSGDEGDPSADIDMDDETPKGEEENPDENESGDVDDDTVIDDVEDIEDADSTPAGAEDSGEDSEPFDSNDDKQKNDEFLQDLDKEEDVKNAVELIRNRVADAEQDFIKRNAEDKKKIDELLGKISDNVKTVKDISNDESLDGTDNNTNADQKDEKEDVQAQIAKETVMATKRLIHDIRENKTFTVYEKFVKNFYESVMKNEAVMESFMTESNTMDTPAVVQAATVMYGWLETVNTLKLEKVDAKYIEKTLNSIN